MPFRDKEKEALSNHEYYIRNREKILHERIKYRKNNLEKVKKREQRSNLNGRKKLENFKKSKGCKRCKIKNPIVLQFHHRDPKTKLFTIGNKHKSKWKKVLEEIQKCDILCANCHLILHSKERHK